MKLLKDCFTGIDNETYDVGRVLGVVSTLSYIIFTALTLAKFSALEYAGGLGSVLGAVGIMLKLKETTEPKERK